MLADLDIDVSRVQGLSYSYTAVVRVDPSRDGTVTSLDAYRAPSKTRTALAAASGEQPSPKPTG